MRDTAEKIDSFGSLPVGWHYGEGGPADPETVRRATLIFIMMMTRGFTQTNAFPGVEGEIAITAYAEPNETYLMIVVQPGDLYDIEYELDGKVIVDLCDIQLEEIAIELGQILVSE